MSDIAIKVEGLGKKYRIGHKKSGDLRESFGNLIQIFKQKTNNRSSVAKASEDKDFWALKDISFEVKQGEAVGIIGRNGAGKSTLLKILSRITKPTTGRFEINGRVSSLLEVGTGFHPELTGRENIYLNGTILGMRRAEIKNKFDEIIAFSGVEEFIDTPVKHYSSGMKVRLAFSVAAHLEPEILIIDEVLAVGDAEFQKKCLGKMEDVAGQGRTVLFVSHNMKAVNSLCSKGIVLDNGKIVSSGIVSNCIQNYLNNYSAIFNSNFSERTDRVGNGAIKVTKIEIIDSKDSSRNILSIDTPFTIKLYYKILNCNYNYDNLIVGIGFEDTNGNRVLLHHNRLVGATFGHDEVLACNCFIFKADGVNVNSNSLKMHYSIMKGLDYIDHLDNAIEILFEEKYPLNYKELPNPSASQILINANWSII